jgi:hypothetical protein
VITVADLLGRRSAPVGAQNGRPGMRTAVSVGALMRREGRTPHHTGRPLGPRAERTTGLSSSPGRKLANTAGAVVAVGSLAGAAALLGHTVPGPAGTTADGTFPAPGGTVNLPGRPGPDDPIPGVADGNPGTPAGFTPVVFSPVVFSPPSVPSTVASSAAGPHLLPPAPALGPTGGFGATPLAAVAPGATSPTSPVTAAAPSGSPIGGAMDQMVSGGGGAVGGTVSSLGSTMGALGDATGGPLRDPVRAVGGAVDGLGSGTTETGKAAGAALDHTVATAGSTVNGLLGGATGVTKATGGGGRHSVATKAAQRSSHTKSSPAGSALSSLTKPITHGDTVGGLLGGSGRHASSDSGDSGSSGRHSSSSRHSGSGSHQSSSSGHHSSDGGSGGGLGGAVSGLLGD